MTRLALIRDAVFVRLALAEDDKAAGKWCLLFPLGETKHRKDFPGGRITFDAAFCESLVRNWEAEGKPQRALNYCHRGASVAGDVTPIDGKVAAGWMVGLMFDRDGKGPERKDGPGVYLLPKWNERARQYILADEFRYLSPEFAVDAQSKATGKSQGPTLFGAALLNDPFLTELPAVAAAEQPETPMTREQLCKQLHLAAGASDMQLMQACAKKCAECAAACASCDPKDPASVATCEKLCKECAALCEECSKMSMGEAPGDVKALTEARDAATAKLSAVEAEATKLAEAVKERDAKLEKLQADTKANEVKAFFDAQTAAFRVSPAEREGFEKLALAHGLDCVRFVEKRPAMKSASETGITGEVGQGDKLKDAQARWDAKLAELEGKGVKGMDAHDAAKLSLSEDFNLLFGSAELEAKLAARPA